MTRGGGPRSVGQWDRKSQLFIFGSARRPATGAEVELYGGLPGEEYDIITQVNTGDVKIQGFEIGFRQNFEFLPDWGSGLESYVNYTRAV